MIERFSFLQILHFFSYAMAFLFATGLDMLVGQLMHGMDAFFIYIVIFYASKSQHMFFVGILLGVLILMHLYGGWALVLGSLVFGSGGEFFRKYTPSHHLIVEWGMFTALMFGLKGAESMGCFFITGHGGDYFETLFKTVLASASFPWFCFLLKKSVK